MVPVVLPITTRVAWFAPELPMSARVGWLLAAVGAGGLSYGVAVTLLGGADVAALRRTIAARLRRRP
jgi:hypothetical protein